ncbi:hypothetical protein COCNU_03G003020 [Cocos nucifera]|uniref:Uncharacterized protein n=1 Tax=Cocos nucifera TaxID=13894 RepID=A0A8K0MY41_COCNU|nr:hypothetical protein COCNU_03G003020 [Cocos nucifera]
MQHTSKGVHLGQTQGSVGFGGSGEERSQAQGHRVGGPIAKSILEAVAQAVEEFKIFFEMKDLTIAFSQKAFIKGFELCEGKVAWRFLELDLSFLEKEEAVGEEAGPSSTRADLSFVEPTMEVPEPTSEVPEPTESAPTSSTTAAPEVEDLE